MEDYGKVWKQCGISMGKVWETLVYQKFLICCRPTYNYQSRQVTKPEFGLKVNQGPKMYF